MAVNVVFCLATRVHVQKQTKNCSQNEGIKEKDITMNKDNKNIYMIT